LAEHDIGVSLAGANTTAGIFFPLFSLDRVLNHSASGTAFDADDGATLLMAFRGLQVETAQQGGVHQAIARELHQLVADPFEKWAKSYHVGHIHPLVVIQ